MGVLNVTPDSFSDGGRFVETDVAIQHALDLVEQGADLIDVGGESTRPGAVRVGADEEQARAIPVIRGLAERGIEVSIDTMNAETALAAAEAGASVVTHLFNGMGPLHHRSPGLAGAALDDRRLVPSLIADGVHVHPSMLRLALRARPDAVLVTDAVATAPPVQVRGGAAYLPDGTLAGSTLTMAGAVRRVAALGVSPAATIRCATGNAARAIGATEYGRIAPGCRADLVALDPVTLEVRAVWAGGRRR